MELTLKEGKELIKLARDAIYSKLFGKEPAVSDALKKKFSEKRGVFVTLKRNNELRGCIGYVEALFPLYDAIIKAAKAAAFSDPRFSSLMGNEFKDIKIEVSVLTKPELIDISEPEEYLKKIKVGSDGLIVSGMYGSGLLLPQVATENGWNAEEFLEHTCIKAGLYKEAWKESNVKVYRFQAQVFDEG